MNGNLNFIWNVSDKVSLNLGYQRSEQDTSRENATPLFPQDSTTDQVSGAVMVTFSPSASLNLQLADARVSSKSSPQSNNTGLNVEPRRRVPRGQPSSASPRPWATPTRRTSSRGSAS